MVSPSLVQLVSNMLANNIKLRLFFIGLFIQTGYFFCEGLSGGHTGIGIGHADGGAGIADVDARDARGSETRIDLAVGLGRVGHRELGKLPEGLNILCQVLTGDEHDGQGLAIARQFALATPIPQLLHLGQFMAASIVNRFFFIIIVILFRYKDKGFI